jgi:hypothetical protein
MALPLPTKAKIPNAEEDVFIKVFNSRLGGGGRAVPTDMAPKVSYPLDL